MSNNRNPSIELLPVEIFHRIFDQLDTETIIFSIRLVSRLFRSIVQTYDRYVLDFQFISKRNFYVLCRLINPESVISLTLSNDEWSADQIALFLSFDRPQQFTRLRSLTLLSVKESEFNVILKQVNLRTITSFSCKIRNDNKRSVQTTNNLLELTLGQSTLRRLELDLKAQRMSQISWPNNCTIQCLIINQGITMKDLYMIFRCSPHLHTLNIKQQFSKIMNDIIQASSPPACFPQLTSLTLEQLDVTINILESFLILTPSLVYLKLIGREKVIDGKRWEEFCETNLFQLNKFEFYFSEWQPFGQIAGNMKLFLSSFQTPFWIEQKKWFVTCEYLKEDPHFIYLYSLPICKSCLIYEANSQKISFSTYTPTTDSDRSMMNNVQSLFLSFEKSLADNIQNKEITANPPLFPQVTEMDLHYCADWPWSCSSLQSLSMFVDISRIVRVKISSFYFERYSQYAWKDIGLCLEQACNLSYLVFQDELRVSSLAHSIEKICSILPRHIKHLQISVNDLEQINRVLKRCENLATIKIDNATTISLRRVIIWFAENTINTTCQEIDGTITVWLGKERIQSTERCINHKRIKFTENN